MATLMETLYDVVFSPAKAMRDIAGSRKIKQAFIVFFVSMALPLWGLSSTMKAANLPEFAGPAIMMPVFGSLVMWFLGAAIFSLTAELFGGQGNAAGLFAAMGFIHIPKLFTIPLWALAIGMPAGLRSFILAAGLLLVFIWTVYLEISAIKGAYQISGSKAFAVLVFPVAAIVLMAFVAVAFFGIAAMSAVPMRWL